ncbi:hypothetical protein NV63_16645 [Elizabethkingia anophelis]|nr:hypothetical protein NV63_16645 [Elizabethkingia anophelis]
MDKDLHPGRNYQVGWKEGILLATTFLFMQFVITAWIQIQIIVFHSDPTSENFFYTIFLYISIFGLHIYI